MPYRERTAKLLNAVLHKLRLLSRVLSDLIMCSGHTILSTCCKYCHFKTFLNKKNLFNDLKIWYTGGPTLERIKL